MAGRVIEKQYVVGKGMALAGVPERQSKATGQKIIEDKTPPRVRSDQENRTNRTNKTDRSKEKGRFGSASPRGCLGPMAWSRPVLSSLSPVVGLAISQSHSLFSLF